MSRGNVRMHRSIMCYAFVHRSAMAYGFKMLVLDILKIVSQQHDCISTENLLKLIDKIVHLKSDLFFDNIKKVFDLFSFVLKIDNLFL